MSSGHHQGPRKITDGLGQGITDQLHRTTLLHRTTIQYIKPEVKK